MTTTPQQPGPDPQSTARPRRSEQLCALCEQHPSTRLGEHVLVSWLVDDLFPPSDGPYGTQVNGVAVARRDGEPRTHNHLPRLLLPVCNESTGGVCNATLNTRFETEDAKAGIRALYSGDTLTPKQVETAGLWWLKTLLLSKHPDADAADDGPRRPVWDRPVEQELYRWMIDRNGPPEFTSVWISRRHPGAPTLGGGADIARINLPFFEHHGVLHRSRVAVLGVGDIYATLLVHPGWSTTHPLELTGHAVRIWPWAGGPLSLTDLVPCGPKEIEVLKHTFGYRVTLHLAPGFDPLAEPLMLDPCWDAEPIDPGRVIGASWG